MLEADAIERIGELDVDPEVVAIELELVAGTDAAVLASSPSAASFQWRYCEGSVR
jgi:hypothetical protein